MKKENLKTTKTYQLVRKSLMIFVALLMVACSSDDDSDGSTNSNAPDGVPSGLIVPESERAFVLTGSDEGEAGLTSKANGKTWKYDFGKFLYSDSCGEEDETITQEIFLTFRSNGTIEYSNQNGNVFQNRTYEWGPSKDYVLLDGNSEVKFIFSELNNDQVVYYSEQSIPNCDRISFEVLNQPSKE